MPPEYSDQAVWFMTQLLPHESKLRSWLLGRFPDANNIDDIIQDSYLRVLEAEKAATVRSPKAFLFRTARNLALDHLRSHTFSRTVPLPEGEAPCLQDSQPAIPEAVSRQQEYDLMEEAIRALPKRCRQIFTFSKIYGMTQVEIAHKLGLSEGSVAKQLQIGLKKCSQYIERYEKGGRA